MAKFQFTAQNQTHYQRVKRKQTALAQIYEPSKAYLRRCPYCNHKVEYLYEGFHPACSLKCDKCKEIITFPPIKVG